MDDGVVIRSQNMTIIEKPLEDVKGFQLMPNKEIFYLPINVAENFPNLLAYIAFQCRIQRIDKINFKNMTKLQLLDIRENQISQIKNGTFDDLLALQHLMLSKEEQICLISFLCKSSLFLLRSKSNQFHS